MVHILSLLMLLKVFRHSVVRNKKTCNERGQRAHNSAVVFYMDP